MPSESDSASGVNVEHLLEEVEQLTPEQRAELRAKLNEEPQPPMAGWSPDPLKLKGALKYLNDGGEATREELAEYLSSIDEISEITSMDYGLAGRSSNDIFHIEKGDSKAEDLFSLTQEGEQLSEMFDDDLNGLRPVEKSLYRGLSLYGHMGAFLGVLEKHRQNGGHPDGMLKEEIVDEMEEFYGGEASNYTGYLGTLCDRLELINRSRDGNRARYKISVPERW